MYHHPITSGLDHHHPIYGTDSGIVKFLVIGYHINQSNALARIFVIFISRKKRRREKKSYHRSGSVPRVCLFVG